MVRYPQIYILCNIIWSQIHNSTVIHRSRRKLLYCSGLYVIILLIGPRLDDIGNWQKFAGRLGSRSATLSSIILRTRTDRSSNVFYFFTIFSVLYRFCTQTYTTRTCSKSRYLTNFGLRSERLISLYSCFESVKESSSTSFKDNYCFWPQKTCCSYPNRIVSNPDSTIQNLNRRKYQDFLAWFKVKEQSDWSKAKDCLTS
jgi:hypothetical protein